ncbi:MAG: 30S ribosomal protein S16 [Candidatus Parcubacteria bacterium]|nr:30S ribosomal protein S16 [Patescibacteria group bacterium]BCX16233.1 MAG: 30S ribosomal protein S16 [Candidatus Parcubacteria bacterium]
MLKIKLRPVGKKKQISFRVVVAEARSKLQGKFIDDLGWYNPHIDKFSLNQEKVKKWLSQGAQPTETVHNILVSAGIIAGPKIPLHKKSKKEVQAQSSAEVGTQSEINQPTSSAQLNQNQESSAQTLENPQSESSQVPEAENQNKESKENEIQSEGEEKVKEDQSPES